MSRSILVNNIVAKTCTPPIGQQSLRHASRAVTFRPLQRKWDTVKNASKNTDLALNNFDSLYSKIYNKTWPSIRLGLLSPKKHCAILNTFLGDEHVPQQFHSEEVVDLARYYKKHLQNYTRYMLREQIIANKKTRKRELLAKNANVSVNSVDPENIEVSDVSDSEFRGAESTGASEGFSSAEDLMAMFSDRRMDDDEKYFINQSSTQLSLNNFVPTTQMIYQENIQNDLVYYDNYNPDLKFDFEILEEPTLEFCNELKVYTYPRTSWSRFEPPNLVRQADLFTHYLLDGASILPVLALDLQLNDVCADYCAAPGGKSLAMLMTLRPKYLLCNDSSTSRLGKLFQVIRQYAPDIAYLRSTLHVDNKDARRLVQPDSFDKILVDAPCSNDRTSVESMDNNIFKRGRTEERLSLPMTQCDILKSALKSLRPKGSVVYSTCTMSPLENDAVVERALLQLQEENCTYKFAVMNLKEAFRPLRGLYQFKTDFKYGQQVVPSITSNFGPMYICKIKRLS